jgi:hypothetical protein
MQESGSFLETVPRAAILEALLSVISAMAGQPTATLTGLPIRLSISTSVSIVRPWPLLILFNHVGDTRTRNHQDLGRLGVFPTMIGNPGGEFIHQLLLQ